MQTEENTIKRKTYIHEIFMSILDKVDVANGTLDVVVKVTTTIMVEYEIIFVNFFCQHE